MLNCIRFKCAWVELKWALALGVLHRFGYNTHTKTSEIGLVIVMIIFTFFWFLFQHKKEKYLETTN